MTPSMLSFPLQLLKPILYVSILFPVQYTLGMSVLLQISSVFIIVPDVLWVLEESVMAD